MRTLLPTAYLRAQLTSACIGLLVLGCAGVSKQDPSPKAQRTQPSFVVADSHSASFDEFAVAADETQASAAGAEILAQGGNAADAAAATMLALGVSSFASSGLGGGGFALYYRAKDQSVTFLDFRERAPGAASADMFDKAPSAKGSGPFSAPSQQGGLAVAVPGEPAGIEALLTEFGSLPRRQVTAPAIRLAERGFRISERVASMSQWLAADLAKDPHTRGLLANNPKGFVVGSTLKRPVLGKTLRTFAEHGARPFYHGAIAKDIIATVQRHGGIMQMHDLAAYRVKKRNPLQGHAFGYRWITAPPPSAGGYILLSSLSLLDRWVGQTATLRGRPAACVCGVVQGTVYRSGILFWGS
jgi:gamma-glutamyltranspeptidase/glutathione hydrolase